MMNQTLMTSCILCYKVDMFGTDGESNLGATGLLTLLKHGLYNCLYRCDQVSKLKGKVKSIKHGFVSRKNLASKAFRYHRCYTRVHTVLPATKHEPYLPLLPNRRAPLLFGWYSLDLCTEGWPGWVDLGGWSDPDKLPLWELNPDTVTHLSTNRAQRRATSLIWPVSLPTTPNDHVYVSLLTHVLSVGCQHWWLFPVMCYSADWVPDVAESRYNASYRTRYHWQRHAVQSFHCLSIKVITCLKTLRVLDVVEHSVFICYWKLVYCRQWPFICCCWSDVMMMMIGQC